MNIFNHIYWLLEAIIILVLYRLGAKWWICWFRNWTCLLLGSTVQLCSNQWRWFLSSDLSSVLSLWEILLQTQWSRLLLVSQYLAFTNIILQDNNYNDYWNLTCEPWLITINNYLVQARILSIKNNISSIRVCNCLRQHPCIIDVTSTSSNPSGCVVVYSSVTLNQTTATTAAEGTCLSG